MRFVLYLHILGATVWVGGMIVVASLVPTLRQRTDIETVRAVARKFGTVSWIALTVQVTTGVIMIFDRVWTGPLMLKIGLVMVSALIALWHQFVAKEQTPAMRGAVEGIILGLGLVIVWLGTGI